MAINCPSPVKIVIIDGDPIEASESDSKEFTYQVDEKVGDDFYDNHEPSKDNIEHYDPDNPLTLSP